MKTNIIQVDLRTLTNYKLQTIDKVIDVSSEIESRGDYVGSPSHFFGIYPTLEQYLNGLPEPQYKDTRNEGGC